jgi:hypothetical protein
MDLVTSEETREEFFQVLKTGVVPPDAVAALVNAIDSGQVAGNCPEHNPIAHLAKHSGISQQTLRGLAGIPQDPKEGKLGVFLRQVQIGHTWRQPDLAHLSMWCEEFQQPSATITS